VSHAPVAVDDHATVEGNKRVEVRVLKNDSDADGDLDPRSLRIVAPPSAGEAKIHDKTEIRYDAPKGNRTRQIVIRYRICDRAGHCSEANLRVTVTPER
jgi:large repetitive protein